MAAKGIAPGLKPSDALAVMVALAAGTDDGLAATARATLDHLPAPLLNGALGSNDLPATVLDAIAPRYARDVAVMEKILTQPTIAIATVVEIASRASEMVAELVATNEELLLANPAIIEKLYMNKATRMSTADRILELAVRNKIELSIPAFREAAQAIVNELIAEPSPEPTPDDQLYVSTDRLAAAIPLDTPDADTHVLDEDTGEEKVVEKFVPLHIELEKATVSQRIRHAMLGSASARAILIRDRNRLVVQAVVQSPLIQESEIVRISANRSSPDEVLRLISHDKRWGSSHQVKVNLVTNPHSPISLTAKLIPHLREHELKALAKSKNVSGAISKLAKQQLERKGIK
jgi:hypothetical protein